MYYSYLSVLYLQPRTEEDKQQFKEDLKRFKENKEKLKRQKQLIMVEAKKHLKTKPGKTQKGSKHHKITVKTKLKEITTDMNSEAAKKIKEAFRSNMASVMVGILNAYRKPECKEGRITNTEDFKHLARKVKLNYNITAVATVCSLPFSFVSAHTFCNVERNQAL